MDGAEFNHDYNHNCWKLMLREKLKSPYSHNNIMIGTKKGKDGFKITAAHIYAKGSGTCAGHENLLEGALGQVGHE